MRWPIGMVVTALILEVLAPPGARADGSRQGPLEFSVGGLPAFRLESPGAQSATFGASPNVVGGFGGNFVLEGVVGATIGGGGTPSYPDCGATGLCPNTVLESFGTIGGGLGNIVGLGDGLTPFGVVGGGNRNVATGAGAVVGGGAGNVASGGGSTIPGGLQNEATAAFSFAAGCQAKAHADGTFVWVDSNCDLGPITTPNRMFLRASGGVAVRTNSQGDPATGASIDNGEGAWSPVSDRATKTGFEPVDGLAVLRKLVEMPISTWRWRGEDPAVRHMGPVAQDFREAFGLGKSELHIMTVDADGVALAAIQGLHALTAALQKATAELAAREDALETREQALEARTRALEARTRVLETAVGELAALGARMGALEAIARPADGAGMAHLVAPGTLAVVTTD